MPRAFGSTSCWRFSVLLDWRSPLKGISTNRKTSNQSTPHMLICNLVALPGAITLNVFTIIRRSVAIPALADVPFTSELYDKAFADFAMSNLGVSIAANASSQTKPEGK